MGHMQVTIFGANGKVGSLVVEACLEMDYDVVAFIYGKNNFNPRKRLQIINGNIYNIEDVEKALIKSDAVISALGSWRTPNKNILTMGMKNIIPTMQNIGIKRIISLTGADANLNDEYISFFRKLFSQFLKIIAKKIIQDAETHMHLLTESDLSWTVIRSPVMNNNGSASAYKFTDKRPLPWTTINRKSVALAMVKSLVDNKYEKKAPYITRK